MLRHVIKIFFVYILFANTAAANEILDIKFSELPGEQVELRALFKEPPEVPAGYSIEQPARIVFDLPNVQNRLKQKKYALGFGNAQSAVVLSTKDRTRIILNLLSSAAYSTSLDGNSLIIVIDSGDAEKTSFTRVQQKESESVASINDNSNSIVDIDFRRVEGGAGTIVLSLNNPKVAVDIEQDSVGVKMTFVDTDVKEALRRRLDVIDFATPVKFIETDVDGSSTVISIEAEGKYDYLAYQADGAYVVNISPLTDREVAEQEKQFSFVGDKLSLNFQDIEVRKVLEIIADFTDLNLVASDTVQGNITLRLENVPWDQALELVLKSKGLDKRQSGNILLVAPAAEIAERERQELESRKQLEELEPLRTEFILIRYADATSIADILKSDGSTGAGELTMLSPRGRAVVDERTNSVLITDTASSISAFRDLIEKIDVPVRQVMIEARIISASDTFRRELGVQFNAVDALDATVNESFGGDVRTNASTQSAAIGTFGIDYVTGGLALDLEISALENAGYGEVISQPRILTGDKQTARIESGQQIPFTSSDGTTVTTIFQDAVLSLEVTPQITPDNRIIMELKINRDSLDGDTITASGSPINVTELTTTALVGDGDTIVLGGIFEQTSSTSESKVPLLGDLPAIGRLFRRDIKIDEKTELLIFITPRILSDSVLDKQ